MKGVMTGTTTLTLIWFDTQKGNLLMAKREAKGIKRLPGKECGKERGFVEKRELWRWGRVERGGRLKEPFGSQVL
jgi:hypothetical protein